MKRTALVLLLTITLGACGREEPSWIAYPKGENDRVLSVLSTGGFTNPGDNLSDAPTFILYGDGRFLSQVYRDPSLPQAIPEIVVRRISAEGIQAILSAAKAAELFGPEADFGPALATDVSTTYFQLQADGRLHIKSVYALFTTFGQYPVDWEARRRRLAVQAFYERMFDLEGWMPEGSVGKPEALGFERFLLFADDEGSLQDPDSPIPPAWPLPIPLNEMPASEAGSSTRCTVLSEDELDVLRGSHPATGVSPSWSSSGRTFLTFLRPLLPGETDCHSVEAARPQSRESN